MRCFAAANEKEKARAFGEEGLALFTQLEAAQPTLFEGYKEAAQAELAALLND